MKIESREASELAGNIDLHLSGIYCDDGGDYLAVQGKTAKRTAAEILAAFRDNKLAELLKRHSTDPIENLDNKWDFPGVKLADLIPSQTLIGTDIRGSNLPDACLSGFKLELCNLSASNLIATDLSRVNVLSSKFFGVDGRWSNWNNAYISDTVLVRSRLAGADLSGCNLSRCDLTGADLRGVRAVGTNFSGSILDNCNLSGSDLHNAEFAHAKFDERTNFSFARITLPRFYPTDFRKANFFKCEIRDDGAIVKPQWNAVSPADGEWRYRIRLWWIRLLRDSPWILESLLAAGLMQNRARLV